MPKTETATVRLGTRASPLALYQAREVQRLLRAAHPGLAVEVVTMETEGDRIQDRTLAEIGGKGLFTRDIEARLDDGRVDMAVHSMKDVPTTLPGRFALASVLARADVRDVLVARAPVTLSGLKPGSVLGTASIRRQAQILAARPDLTVIPFRGNVHTRLRKLDEGQADATLLARAGLDRLGMTGLGCTLEPEEMLPAAGQGAIGVEIRARDARARDLLASLGDRKTAIEVGCERALLGTLDGSCRTPIAALAELDGERLWLRALVVAPDGRRVWRAERRGAAADGEAMGRDAGEELRRAADPAVFLGPR